MFDGKMGTKRGMNQFKFGTWEKCININIISNNRSIPLRCKSSKCEWTETKRMGTKLITTWFIYRIVFLFFFWLIASAGCLFSFFFHLVVSQSGWVRFNFVCTTYGESVTPFSHFIQMICFNFFCLFLLFFLWVAINITRAMSLSL